MLIKDILSSGDFHLAKWKWNPTLLQKWRPSKQTLGEDKEILLTEEDKEKILGVCRKPLTDTLTFRTISTEGITYIVPY